MEEIYERDATIIAATRTWLESNVATILSRTIKDVILNT